MGVAEVAEAPVALADVMDCGRLVTRLACLAEFTCEALELRQGLLRAVLPIDCDGSVEARIKAECLAMQVAGEQQTEGQDACKPNAVSSHGWGLFRDPERDVFRAHRLVVGDERVDVHKILGSRLQRR